MPDPIVAPEAPAAPAPEAPVAPEVPAAPEAPPSAPAIPPAASDASLLDVAGLVNPDGSFVVDWHKSDKLPEDIRGSDSLAPIKNLNDLAKRTIHAEKMVGKNKIAVPKADASPEDIAAFQEAVGAAVPSLARPATADDYKFEVPEGLEGVFTDEKMKASRELAHGIHATQSQFEQFMQADAKATVEAQAAAEQERGRLHDEAVLALKKEWGEAYPERQHVVKRLIAEAFGADTTGHMNFLEKYAGDPDFVRFAATVGSRMVESKALVAELTQTTSVEATRKIADLNATPGYLSMSSDMTDAQRTEITRQIQAQYAIAYPKQQ